MSSDTCRDFDSMIARSAQLTAGETAQLESHLTGCDSCRELARALAPVDDAAFADEGEEVQDLPESTRYRITGEVGRGGIGRVMAALDQLLDRPVALKELFSTSAGMRKRFMREALITARLQHPSIVPVYDAGSLGDRSPFYAMKLVEGRPFDQAIAEAKTLAQRLALVPTALAIADAIAYAHGHHIVHRDLKPTNVLVGKYGETIVIDWGLAKDLATDDPDALDAGPYRAASADQTVAGAVLGTPAYMAPEQAAGEAIDERADVYALGAILYHAISGRAPHEGNTLEEMVRRVAGGEVRPLTEREPEVPRDLAAIVSKAMALDPTERYPDAQGLADELRRFLTGQLVASHTYALRELVRRWIKRHRAAVTVGLAALVVVGIVATLAIRNILIARAEATASREEARRRLAVSYADRAGTELAAGQPARALAYAIASAQVVGLTPQTRLMAAHALEQLPPVRWWSGTAGVTVTFAPGTHDLLLSTHDVARWSPDSDRVIWRVPGEHAGDLALLGRDTVVFSHDNAVSLLRIADGTSIGELPGPQGGRYTGLIGMDDGGHWLAAEADDRIDLFDLTTRKFVTSVPFANSWRAPLISADGERLIVRTPDQVTSVVERSGKVLATFKSDVGPVFLAGDELVYALEVGQNGIAHLVVGDALGKPRLDLPIGISSIHALAVDVAAKRIALGTEDGLVQVRSLESGEVAWQASLGDRAGFVLFDGDVLRVASSNTVVGFDVASGLEVERAALPAGTAMLAASDDHARVAALVVGVGNAVWASTRRELVSLAPTPARVVDLALAPDGTVITGGEDGELHELRAGQPARRLAGGAPIKSLARQGDGTSIAATADGTVVVRDRDGRELRRFAGGLLAVPSPDGRLVATSTSDGTIAIWDPATGTRVRSLGTVGPGRFLRWSSDGRRVAALATEGNAAVWDVDGRVVREIPKGNMAGGNLALSNDGRWLAHGGEPSDTLFALDGGTDRKLLEASRQGAAVVVAFSPDNTTVLVAGLGFLSTWDIATATPRLHIATQGFVTAGAFFDNANYIIAGGMDHRMHVWNAHSGAELLAFTVPAQPRKVVVDPSSSHIAILAGRGGVLWTVPTFAGSLAELRERARCSLELEVVDAQLRTHSLDIAACNRIAW